MKDQVDALVQKGIDATFVNSSLTRDERNQRYQQIGEGRFDLLYVTPERFRKPEIVVHTPRNCLLSQDDGDGLSDEEEELLEDLEAGSPGQYVVRVKDNTRAYDTAYPGVEILPDGTFVTTTYGHWTKDEAPYVLSVRFKLEELDALAENEKKNTPGQ